MRIGITREVRIPDPVKLERYRRTPELGPRVLFFSGGTALRDTSHHLISLTHNSIHIITPFDSGGSSAVLRKAFAMPAVGDIRNRLMALADQTLKGNPEIFELFAYRLDHDSDRESLLAELRSMADGRHRLVRRVPGPMRKIIRNYFFEFLNHMPEDFDLRGASLGNVVLTAGYLANRRQIEPVIYLFSKLVQVCGTVLPVVGADCHIAAELDDGEVVVGQHLLTGKEAAPLERGVRRIWLTGSLDSREPVRVAIRRRTREVMSEAELICYPVGSFYTSLIANLLPSGVGRAIADNACPKVFVPNTSHDPELVGLSVAGQVRVLLDTLCADDSSLVPQDVLQYVMVDSARGQYPTGLDIAEVEQLGVRVIDCRLVSRRSAPHVDPVLLCGVLLSLT
ncbi:GAK system CofD-like protein [Pseudodesulfovibrio tunisiensis]|uniref:GAK system CofD-like protein n=1 Tax=Pseudodesulfovibrio tunisiensis TaxID=463192 RepID=UPI001FB3013C|nr:GAK system CofD-like protein [Pseudodesulfovibrio tunisiensis]